VSIGDKVRATRKAAGISQEEVARRAGVSLNVINRLERGVILDPHYSTLRGIASALEVPVEDLVREPALARKAEAPDPGSRDQSLISRPEIWKWLLEQGHRTQEEFLSLAGELERLEEVEGAISELHETRDGLIEKLKDRSVQADLFDPPCLEGLVGDDRIREIFRPVKLAWQLEWEIRSEYLARETALVNYSRMLFVEGEAEDYLVRGSEGEHDHEHHELMLEERRRMLEEKYAAQLAAV
jgi:transcriptional regulator with XRE-family HTH domain